MGKELWSARHVAVVTGISNATVCNATAAGVLKGTPIKNGDSPPRWVYTPSAVRAWLRAQIISNHQQRPRYVMAAQRLKAGAA